MTSCGKFLLIASFARSVVLFRLDLIKELQGKNLEVHVAFPSNEEDVDVIDELIHTGVTVHQIPLARNSVNPVSDARTIIALVRLLWRLRPRYVLAYTIKPVLYGSIAAWITRVPNRFALVTGLGHSLMADSTRL